MKIWSF